MTGLGGSPTLRRDNPLNLERVQRGQSKAGSGQNILYAVSHAYLTERHGQCPISLLKAKPDRGSP